MFHITDIVSTYSYDLRQRLLAVARGDGSSTGYQYDRDGNLLAVTSILAPGATPQTTSYVYNALNRLTTETHADGRQTTYTYDAAGHMTSRTDAAGTTSYHYNALGEMDRLTDRLGQVTTFTYDTDGYQTEIDYPGGIVRKVGYNADGTTTSIDVTAQVDGTQQTDVQLAYTFWDEQLQQPTPQPTQVTDIFGDTITTTYGPGGTVQNVTMVDTNGRFVSSSTYTWNAAGQCTSEVDNNAATSFTDVTTTYTYDDSGQLTAINGVALTHDGTGRILDNTVATFQYDQANQVIAMTPTGGTPVPVSYGDGTNPAPSAIGQNTYEYSATGLEKATVDGTAYTYTTTPDGHILEITTASGTYYPQTDAYGSIVGLIDSDGNVHDACIYDSNGTATCTNNDVPQPQGFAGMLTTDVLETGTTLYVSLDGAGFADTQVPHMFMQFSGGGMPPVGWQNRYKPTGFSNFQEKYGTHVIEQREWGKKGISDKQYVEKAYKLFEDEYAPGESPIRQVMRANGEVLRFNSITQEFGVMNAEGEIITFYRVDGTAANALRYWEGEVRTAVEGGGYDPGGGDDR